MKILIIERNSSNSDVITIRAGTVEGDDSKAWRLPNIPDIFIDPTSQERRKFLDELKRNADAIFEVDHISTMENQTRLK